MIKAKQFLVHLFTCFLTLSALAQSSYYVSPEGDDKNPGTLSMPFATLEKAIQTVSTNLKQGPATTGVSIFLRKGVYRLTKSIRIDSSLSGTENAPVFIGNYNNESVIINGGVSVSPELIEEVRDQQFLSLLPPNAAKVFQVNLKRAKITDFGEQHSHGFRRPYYPSAMELFVNRKPMHLARYPNNDMIPLERVISQGSVPANGDFGKIDAKFGYTNTYFNRWKNANDAWLGGYFMYGFADDEVPIRAVDVKDKTIETNGPSLFGFSGGQPYQRWYAYNLKEELDEPGEYYIDRKNGILYFIPTPDVPVSAIEVSMLETPMISLLGTSYVTISGISFENTRGIGIYEERSVGNKIVNCVFQNIGLVAVVVGKGVKPFSELRHNGTGTPASEVLGSWHEHIYDNPEFNRQGGSKNGIINCVFREIGMGAISLGGGDRKSLQPAGNYVENCDITNFNRLGSSYKGAVNIDGVGNVIRNCHIYNSPHMAIYIHGNNHLISNNEINDVCKEADDMGAIYMGRDPSEAGNIISNNYIHNITPKKEGHFVTGIFLDDGAILNEISGNFFYKCGNSAFGAIVINGGGANKVESNIFVECQLAGTFKEWDNTQWTNYVKADLWQHRLFKAVDITKPPYSTAYPSMVSEISGTTRQAIATRNYMVRCDNDFSSGYKLSNNWSTNRTIDFVDYDKQNFSLRQGADVFSRIAGFENKAFSKMGLKGGVEVGVPEKGPR